MSFWNYTKQLCMFVLSSSLVLGLILGISFLVIGGTTMNVDGDITIGALDGFWLIIALPVLSLLVFLLLSPLSFLVHKLLSKRHA